MCEDNESPRLFCAFLLFAAPEMSELDDMFLFLCSSLSTSQHVQTQTDELQELQLTF